MTQTPEEMLALIEEAAGMRAIAAEASIRPTELGLQLVMKAPGAIVTAEFDIEKPADLVMKMLQIAPQVLLDLMSQAAEKIDQENAE